MQLRLALTLASLMSGTASQRLTTEECAGPRACTREYNPVCGSDGVTYANPCTFRVAQCDNPKLILHALGSCDAPTLICPSGCGYSYEPVCGSDGVTYANDCEFRKAKCLAPSLTLRNAKGACEGEEVPTKDSREDACAAACIALWDPVCGTDGKTYGNSCELNVAKCKQGPSSTLDVLHTGECTDKKVHERGHDSL